MLKIVLLLQAILVLSVTGLDCRPAQLPATSFCARYVNYDILASVNETAIDYMAEQACQTAGCCSVFLTPAYQCRKLFQPCQSGQVIPICRSSCLAVSVGVCSACSQEIVKECGSDSYSDQDCAVYPETSLTSSTSSPTPTLDSSSSSAGDDGGLCRPADLGEMPFCAQYVDYMVVKTINESIQDIMAQHWSSPGVNDCPWYSDPAYQCRKYFVRCDEQLGEIKICRSSCMYAKTYDNNLCQFLSDAYFDNECDDDKYYQDDSNDDNNNNNDGVDPSPAVQQRLRSLLTPRSSKQKQKQQPMSPVRRATWYPVEDIMGGRMGSVRLYDDNGGGGVLKCDAAGERDDDNTLTDLIWKGALTGGMCLLGVILLCSWYRHRKRSRMTMEELDAEDERDRAREALRAQRREQRATLAAAAADSGDASDSVGGGGAGSVNGGGKRIKRGGGVYAQLGTEEEELDDAQKRFLEQQQIRQAMAASVAAQRARESAATAAAAEADSGLGGNGADATPLLAADEEEQKRPMASSTSRSTASSSSSSPSSSATNDRMSTPAVGPGSESTQVSLNSPPPLERNTTEELKHSLTRLIDKPESHL